MNFTFDTVMPREVLENYLSRTATAQWIYRSKTLDDDIRVIKKLGLKYLTRASGIWKAEMPDEEHFALSKAAADKIHQADPEVILQACIFEAIYREDCESTPVPPFVFEAFGKPVENRCFCFDEMYFPKEPGNTRKNYGLPDISQQETQMWFFYRAANYIDCGYESFHMGQIMLYSANDPGYVGLQKTLQMIREYGRIHARRHKVLLDAHSHGIVINGKSLLDYNAMPYTRYPVLDRPGEKLVLVREGNSDGGISPDGWEAECLPFLMEYDNWGGKDTYAHEHLSYEQRAWAQWWGYDQIAWFANQEKESRDSFLIYTYIWTAVNNPDAYFALPLRRPLESGEVVGVQPFYQLNDKSESCPDGYSQEEAARKGMELFSEMRRYHNPQNILNFGARKVENPLTGVRYPEKVVIYGSFQPYVGAVAMDSNSEITRLYYVGNGTYELSFVMPYKGEYSFGISTWGTLSCCYGTRGGRFPYSGSGGLSSMQIPQDNAVVKVSFCLDSGETSLEIIS